MKLALTVLLAASNLKIMILNRGDELLVLKEGTFVRKY